MIIDLYLIAVGQALFSACFNLLEISDEWCLYLQLMYLWLQLYIFMIISHKRHLLKCIPQLFPWMLSTSACQYML